MRWAVVWALPVVLAAAPAGAQPPLPPVKLIELGWDAPTPAEMRRDIAVMDSRPLDGVILHVPAAGQPKGVPEQAFLQAFARGKWDRAWFTQAVADLQAVRDARPKRLTTNFLRLEANPGDVDWFDDAGWRDIADHCRIAAWVAKQGGLKGICFDPEPYYEPHKQFGYAQQPERARHTFAEYQGKARQRGREVMRAMAAEYPGMTFLTLFMNAITLGAARQPDPAAALATEGYGLYPAFIDGWLDAIPPAMTLVDGNESSYMYRSAADYRDASLAIRTTAQRLVSPENRTKYRAQVQVGMALYLDIYLPKGHSSLPPNYPYTLQAEGPRDQLLREHATWAVQNADEYVWVYGEQDYWWPRRPTANARSMPWPEALPGIERALLGAAHPREAARTEIEDAVRQGAAANLARNAAFAAGPGGLPAEWSYWHEDKSKGVAGLDTGAARIGAETNGCFLQSYDVAPGQRYAVRVRVRWRGQAPPSIRLRWQSPSGEWMAEQHDVMGYPPSGTKSGAWAECFAVATVPPGVGKLVLLLGATGQAGPQETAWFSRPEVYRLSGESGTVASNR